MGPALYSDNMQYIIAVGILYRASGYVHCLCACLYFGVRMAILDMNAERRCAIFQYNRRELVANLSL